GARRGCAAKTSTVGAADARFTPPDGWMLDADETWPKSAVRYLLSSEQKKQYAAMTSAADREVFITAFWNALDPTPATPRNEFRVEFERRAAFAAANFTTTKTPGRATERGAGFAFLGPPA